MAGKPIDSFLVPSARIFAITLRINGAAAPLMPLFGIAGLIELVAGTLIMIGFRAAIPAFYCFVFYMAARDAGMKASIAQSGG